MKRYFQVWSRLTLNSFQTVIASRFGMLIFLFAKLFRFVVFLGFIYFLFGGTKDVLGYGRYQTLLFVETFYLMGAIGQMLFREVYRFRSKLVSGEFDFDLIRPIHPLLRNLAGGFDLLDLLTMPAFIYVLVATILNLHFSGSQLFLYLALFLNGMLIMGSIHVFVAAFGIITTEVDHLVLVYRDLETMGRFPVDVYREPLRQILTFAIPIGLMFTIPAKALLGLLSWQTIFAAFAIGLASIFFSFRFWNFAVRKYSSASS